MRLVLSIFIFALTAVLSLTCVGCNEVQRKHFQSLDKAQEEQMINKGWIPNFTPEDAKDIYIEGDLDAASAYGSYVSSNTDALKKQCSNVEDSFPIPSYGPKWFRADLQEADTAGKLRSKGYEILHCDKEEFNVAIFSPSQHIYYWSVRK